MARTKPTDAPLTIPKLDLHTVKVRIVGDSALICHRWTDEARNQILGKQMKRARTAKAERAPEREFEQSLYGHPTGGYGFPAVAFKSALVAAASFVPDITKVHLRGAVHLIGDLVKIDGKPTSRADMVKVGMGGADVRFRGEFKKWESELVIQFNAGVISAEQVVSLLDVAGFSVGVGDWRPQRNGSFGRFHCARGQE